ncbi:LysR family transcriptional regulator [Pseudomonas sp. NBRC 111131]|uniref:LysR family transcriptional regulator n=1 Tax=Pseudomonas sp. NBRC 111131 TaxID=1661046 RepID=UPI0006D45ED5|nr:LysR family transcriptional regulator [Pseudomonas sp. NBRC 111131]
MRGTAFAELETFVAVAQERSFRRAAAKLGLSPSALSHTVRSLEERLGARLLNRTTRSVGLTEAGAALLARIAPAFTEIRGALDEASGTAAQPAGAIRLNLPKFAARLLMPRLARFARDNPAIRLELRTEDSFADIVAEGFDAGIRLGESLEGDMVAVRVTGDLRLAIVGAPDYFAAHKPPRTPRDLASHTCIKYRFRQSGALYQWPFVREGEAIEVLVPGSITLDDSDLQVAAAIEGAGIACTLEDCVASHLASGKLVRVLDDWCQPFPGFYLYYPGRRQLPAPLRALVGFLKWDA